METETLNSIIAILSSLGVPTFIAGTLKLMASLVDVAKRWAESQIALTKAVEKNLETLSATGQANSIQLDRLLRNNRQILDNQELAEALIHEAVTSCQTFAAEVLDPTNTLRQSSLTLLRRLEEMIERHQRKRALIQKEQDEIKEQHA